MRGRKGLNLPGPGGQKSVENPMRIRGVTLFAFLLLVGCGGGGDGGTPPDTRRTYAVPHVLESSGRISRVAVGDVNGDGLDDLLVQHEETASFSTLLATGLRESPTLPSLGKPKPLARGEGAYAPGSDVLVGDGIGDACDGDYDPDSGCLLVVTVPGQHEVRSWESVEGGSGAARYHSWRWRPSTLTTGAADRVAVGDVNGDGMADIVVLDTTTGQAEILLKTSAGAYTPGKPPPPVGACSGLVLVDLDRDGFLDLVTNRPEADAVAVLHGGLSGAFTLRESPTRASTGRCFAVGDVDGDGWCDLVVLGEDGTSAVCMHQRPGEPGVFDAASSPLGFTVDATGPTVCVMSTVDGRGPRAGIAIDEGGTPRGGLARGTVLSPGGCRCVCSDGFALADVDRDGVLDLVCSPAAGDVNPSPIVVFGIRESPTRFSAGEHVVAGLRESPTLPSKGKLRAVADLDCDGHVDFITGDPDFDLLALYYSGDPSPAPAPNYQERLHIQATPLIDKCIPCDLDRDGRPDLVCATSVGVEIRWQDPVAPGAFGAPTTLLGGTACSCVAVGDLNGDGCPDLLVGVPGACVALIRNPATIRGFLAPLPLPQSPGGNFRSVAVGDVDGDGHLDCVAIRESPSKASLGRGHGDGFFDVFTEFDVAVSDPQDVACADLDGDGHLDVAVCGTGECAVVRQSGGVGPVRWMPPEVLSLQRGVRVAVGDVNGDGRCDVLTSGDEGVEVALQSPFEDGRFLPSFALSSEACGGLAVCDLDRDGRLDACFVEAATGVLVCTSGDPDFDLLRIVSLNGLPPGQPIRGISVAVGDLDGDGRADVVTACPDGSAAGTGAGEIRTFSHHP